MLSGYDAIMLALAVVAVALGALGAVPAVCLIVGALRPWLRRSVTGLRRLRR